MVKEQKNFALNTLKQENATCIQPVKHKDAQRKLGKTITLTVAEQFIGKFLHIWLY